MSLFTSLKALERIEDRLRTLEDLCAEQHRESKKLDLEFTDLYDKVRRQMSRMAKRYAVDSKDAANGSGFEPDNEPSNSVDPVSEGIHKRRARGFLQR